MRMHNGGEEGDLTLYVPSAFREASTPLLFCKPNPCLRYVLFFLALYTSLG